MKIGILGADGRMGQIIAREILSKQYPAELGASAGRNGDKESAFRACDVIIDFTSAKAAPEHAALAAKYKKPLVVGTTGLGAEEEAALAAAAQKSPILYAANMSLGVNLLLALVEQAALMLGPAFDIEIFEAHHRNKIDAPSGTALALGHAAATGRGVKLKDVMILDRDGKRKEGGIGISVFRGGDIVGEHTVTFAGLGERLDLTHKASDRALFAKGAIKAALWLKGQPPGLYSMQDVLGIKTPA